MGWYLTSIVWESFMEILNHGTLDVFLNMGSVSLIFQKAPIIIALNSWYDL